MQLLDVYIYVPVVTYKMKTVVVVSVVASSRGVSHTGLYQSQTWSIKG